MPLTPIASISEFLTQLRAEMRVRIELIAPDLARELRCEAEQRLDDSLRIYCWSIGDDGNEVGSMFDLPADASVEDVRSAAHREARKFAWMDDVGLPHKGRGAVLVGPQ